MIVLRQNISTLCFRQWRDLIYWVCLHLTCLVFITLTHYFIPSPHPTGLYAVKLGNSYPAAQLTFATMQFFTLLAYLKITCSHRLKQILKVFLPIILVLSGIACLYLGDNWLSDIIGGYISGLTIYLGYWLMYRRKPIYRHKKCLGTLILSLITLISMTVFFVKYDYSLRIHQPYFAQYVFTDTAWWEQRKSVLPLFRSNRIGHRVSLFNVQYVGSLRNFELALTKYGWHKENESLFSSLLKRLNGQPSSQDTPLMAQLYLNHKPALIMSYQPPMGEPIILRLWRSNYHLKNFRQPLWLGTIGPYYLKKVNDRPSAKYLYSLLSSMARSYLLGMFTFNVLSVYYLNPLFYS